MSESTGQFDHSSSSQSWLIPVIISIILTAVIAGGGVYWWTSSKQILDEAQKSDQITGNGIKDVHRWNPQPVEVKDLNLAKGLFDHPEGYVKAWDVGTYSDGYGIQSQLDGARIILVALRDDARQGPFGTEPLAACDSVARIFIFKTSLGNSVVYDPKYSPNDILAAGYNFISKDRPPINPNAQFYYELGGDAFIPSLDFPGFIVHKNKTYVLQKDSFPCHIIDAQGKTKLFFDDIKSSLIPTFTDPIFGTAYTDPSQGDIVFRVSDGTYIRYNPL